ncbi:hypothetical protein [Capybara microvirus Cap3_SP_465]|nr:hypothetical protein [Capybara microvirus Cap3_SP_465]
MKIVYVIYDCLAKQFGTNAFVYPSDEVARREFIAMLSKVDVGILKDLKIYRLGKLVDEDESVDFFAMELFMLGNDAVRKEVL